MCSWYIHYYQWYHLVLLVKNDKVLYIYILGYDDQEAVTVISSQEK